MGFFLCDPELLINAESRAIELLHKPAWPLDGHGVDRGGVADAKMHWQHGLRRVASPGFDLAIQRVAAGAKLHAGSNGITIAAMADEFKCDPVVSGVKAIQINRWMIVVDDEIEAAIAVKIGDANPSAIFVAVGPNRTGDVRKLSIPDIGKQTIVLVPIPGVFTDEFAAKKITSFVAIDVCDRTAEKRESKVGAGFVADPPVGGVNIEVGIIIRVEKGDAPAPSGSVGIAVLNLGKRAITVIAKQ